MPQEGNEDIVQRFDQRQLPLELGRTMVKVRWATVAEPRIRPRERHVRLIPLFVPLREYDLVEVFVDLPSHGGSLEQQPPANGDEHVDEEPCNQKGRRKRLVTSDPLDRPLERADAPGQDRLAAEEPRQ